MKKMLRHPAVRLLCWYLALTVSGILMVPAAARASFVSPVQSTLSEMKGDLLADARQALEDDYLTERLGALGLSGDEIKARLDSLSPEEREAVLADVGQIQTGGNGVVTVLIVVLLVLLILKVMDKEIVIK